jgi:hypothetical protein
MSQKFTEAQLEAAFAELIGNEGYPHHFGNKLKKFKTKFLVQKWFGLVKGFL